jgi:5-methylcytosine-specific restriction endonuclease McrA
MSATSGHVLVLNQDYRALAVCGVERAAVLVLLHKAELVAAHADRALRSARCAYPWPSVVRLKAYVHVPFRRILLTRRNVLRRDGNRCQYCGHRERLTLDHVVPRSRGGPDSWDNLVAACVPCNNRKGNRTPEEAAMPLVRPPFRPSHVMFLRDYVGTMEDTWKPFLYAA